MDRKLISKAHKIAAMMQSPYEKEVLVAANMLKKLLADHNTSMQALGLNINIDRTIKNISEANSSDIVEFAYKQTCSTMSDWLEDMIIRISRSYDVKTGNQKDRMLLIGYSSDVEIAKIMIDNLRAFIETQIVKRGYHTNKYTASSYALGVVNRVVSSIGVSGNSIKLSKLTEYIQRSYNSVGAATKTEFRPIRRAYVAGSNDAVNYQKVA